MSSPGCNVSIPMLKQEIRTKLQIQGSGHGSLQLLSPLFVKAVDLHHI